MKLSFSIFLILSFVTVNAYQITIKIKGMPNAKLYLGNYYGDKQYLKDSNNTDADGKIVFKGKDKLQGGIYLIATANKELLFDFVVTEQEFSLETDTSKLLGNMKVKGSLENQVFFDYSRYTIDISNRASVIEKELKQAKEKNDTAAERIAKEKIIKIETELADYRLNVIKQYPGLLLSKVFKMMRDVEIPETPILPNGRKDSLFAYNYYKAHFFDNFDFNDDRLSYTPVFHSRLEYYIKKVIPQIPDSINKAADMLVSKAIKSKENSKWIIYWIADHYERSQYMGMDAVFVHMADKYYGDEKITFWVDEATRFKIKDRADNQRNNLIGNVGPNLTMPDTSFVIRELHQIKSKYTILIFWDANCGRCKEEIPRLKTLYEKLEKKPFAGGKYLEVYAVSLTPNGDEWIKFVRENKLKWINVSDLYNNSKFRKLYDVYSTPVVYLLNEKKEIVVKRLSIEQIEEVIERGIE